MINNSIDQKIEGMKRGRKFELRAKALSFVYSKDNKGPSRLHTGKLGGWQSVWKVVQENWTEAVSAWQAQRCDSDYLLPWACRTVGNYRRG